MSTAPEPEASRWTRLTRSVKRQWRRIRQVGASFLRLLRPKLRTVSEKLFERYLRDQGLRWRYERRFTATLKRPDYTIVIAGQETVFDVKEFEARPDDFLTGVGAFDPYEAVRAKIHGVREQFKNLKHLPCCLVLFNANKPLVDLRPMFVFGAMLGNVRITFPVDVTTGVGKSQEAKTGFFGGGKMVRSKHGQPIAAQNRTISAVVVLRHVRLGLRRLSIHLERQRRKLGRELTIEEILQEHEAAESTDRDPALLTLGVSVIENPYATKRLSAEFGRGPWDERYGPDAGRLGQLYVGSELQTLRDDELTVGIKGPTLL